MNVKWLGTDCRCRVCTSWWYPPRVSLLSSRTFERVAPANAASLEQHIMEASLVKELRLADSAPTRAQSHLRVYHISIHSRFLLVRDTRQLLTTVSSISSQLYPSLSISVCNVRNY